MTYMSFNCIAIQDIVGENFPTTSFPKGLVFERKL